MTDTHSAILFAESLVPDVPYFTDGADGADVTDSAELMELWLIAEVDAAIEALIDGADVFTLGELVRMTPTPKTGALPGLVMVHYERRVDWTEPAGEDFTIEDAATDDEDGEDWEQIDPDLYAGRGLRRSPCLVVNPDYLDGGPCNCTGPICTLNDARAADEDAPDCDLQGCNCHDPATDDDEVAAYTPSELAAFADAYGEKVDADLRRFTAELLGEPIEPGFPVFDADEGDLCGPDAEPLLDPAAVYPPVLLARAGYSDAELAAWRENADPKKSSLCPCALCRDADK